MKHFSLFLLRSCWLLALLLSATQYAGAQPTGCTRPDPSGNPATNGLYAEYYAGYFNDDQSFFTSNPADLVRIDAQLNFPTTGSWGNLVPPAQNTNADPQQFSARYRGSLYVPVAGSYTFYLTSDDASYMWLDAASQALPAQTAQALIDNGGGHGPLERSATVFLSAGLHSVLIHYGEDLYGNTLTWEWESAAAGIARQLVPSANLCTAIQNVLQVPQGISYAPSTAGVAAGAAVSSPVPTVNDGGQPITAFAIANAGSLPAGISIDAATGVLTAAATVPSGVYVVAVALTNASGTSTFGSVFTFDIAPPPPSGCTGLDPGGAAPARGLYGEYYAGYFANDHGFFQANTPGLRRVDALVNFTGTPSWGGIVPPAGGSAADPDEFSVRLRGSLYAPVTGSYTFYLTSDDASFLWLGNAALDAPAQTARAAINNGGLHAARTDSVTVFLTAGLHNVLIHYGEDGGGNVLTLEWKSEAAGLARQPVPAAALCSVVQPQRQPPTALNYAPGSASTVNGRAVSSATPTVSSPLPVAGFALLRPASLPAGISINATTGVLTAAATVPEGRYDVGVAVYNAEGALEQPLAFLFVVTPPPPVGCSGTDPSGQLVAAGLYGEYYAGYFDDLPNNQAFFKLNSPAFARIDPQLNFGAPGSWGDVAPPALGSNADPDRFSARYRGSVYVATAGNYTFHLTSDDASYLWLDDAALASPPALPTALIDNGTGHPPRTISGTVFLPAGLHNLLIHYGEYNGGNVLTLEWESPDAGVARQLLPTTLLCSAVQAARGPLPITLLSFRARPLGRQVELQWETAQEINNDHFELERSTDGRSYTVVGETPGAGNSTTLRRYRYLDARPRPGLSYYRLRQIDKDGTNTVSEPVAVRLGADEGAAPVVTVHPNPNGGQFTVALKQAATADTRLELLDVHGRVVQQLQLVPGSWEQQVQTKLPRGVYLLRLTTPEGRGTSKVVIE
ncbi:T9SS type A sorting domain-containing protein [Hymenobacter gummosus]|uniref:T9SS type A sorting domain-containing protein n=1 Tax=Hymenobacter gummosus TaxID=1776032 RepID=A0A3S0K955_9BACT|nr:PA14 domain-containing protein [Hymenobacter gummosus]RTQ53674.1 T9SS type A sorting domain-containing protein [Hymenobacter gummosus]